MMSLDWQMIAIHWLDFFSGLRVIPRNKIGVHGRRSACVNIVDNGETFDIGQC